jgi:putative tricarboxylic transport membrane protein
LADRILAACTLVLAAAYLYATFRLPAMDIGDPLGPKAFPYLLGGLFAAAAALLLFESRKARPAEADVGDPSRPRAVGVVAAATAVLFALLEPLGYLIALTLFLFGVTSWLHRGKPATCLAVAVLFTIASYALFAKFLGVTLAKGLLHF